MYIMGNRKTHKRMLVMVSWNACWLFRCLHTNYYGECIRTHVNDRGTILLVKEQ